MDSMENEVKKSIARAVERQFLQHGERCGAKTPHGDLWEEFFEGIAEEVYSEIWEYIKDYD